MSVNSLGLVQAAVEIVFEPCRPNVSTTAEVATLSDASANVARSSLAKRLLALRAVLLTSCVKIFEVREQTEER